MEEMELSCFQIISNAGGAKSKYFAALAAVKADKFQQAQALIVEADEIFHVAHSSHANLIQKEARGESVIVSLLLAHAEDQLMSAEMCKEFVLEFIDLFKNYALVKK